MRIALVTGSFLPCVGGVEWKVHFLATEYVKRGHDVVVFCQKLPAKLDGPLPVTPTYELVRVGPRPFPGIGRTGLAAWIFSQRILRYHKRNPLDVLHCHSLAVPTRFGVMVKQRSGLPVVATTCGDDILTVPSINFGVRLVPYYDAMVKHNLNNVDVLGSISGAIHREMEACAPAARIVDIPNGVDWDSFQVKDTGWLQHHLGLPPDAIIILSLGRLHAQKDYPTGLRAFSRLVSLYPAVHYVLVGRNVPTLGELVESLGLAGRVHLLDSVPMTQVPYVLRSADIFFSPSVNEGFAQVVAQALVCGLPCVVSDCPGNEDLRGSPAATVARTGDADDMAAALQALIIDEGRRAVMAETALIDSRKYAWSSIADEYLKLFTELVGETSGNNAGGVT